ncbi:thioredoxin family protein [Empedobacter brevis]|uniref:Thioredoxin n=2 Tax=Empedobacter brevis TaxID=247 RepID=A0A511NL35_9FLAO|nr:thioredoxin family protein [Empedobacter brevis]MDM1071632.1 thioredoxin family protein [Empedobacter brevis]QES93986.1 thioredoxin family protein [Empedobacter brevis]QHC85798.1 hypothetical protein AS589_13915 [Empedobacter brevis]GEM53514.1 thioredoxin [Empedobacter brevis NBRC 14943 = ATCC 43319]
MIIDRIKENKPILINFYTSTCNICAVLNISLDKVKEEFNNQLDIEKINVDDDKVNTIHFDATFQIMGVPTLMLFQNNQLTWKYSGVLFPEDLIKQLKKYIK